MWQHRVPQGTDEMHEEEIEPMWVRNPTGAGVHRRVCKTCRKPIIEVDEDEGPEMLKAMFRF